MSAFDMFCPSCETKLVVASPSTRACPTCAASFEVCGIFLLPACETHEATIDLTVEIGHSPTVAS